MAFIPNDTCWFIGEFVESIKVGDVPETNVHINTLLIEARSAEEAFARALDLGNQMNADYLNTQGDKVVCRFEGIHELNVIHEKLEHGAELFFRSVTGLEECEVLTLVTPRESLAAFRINLSPAQNYYPASIADELERSRAGGAGRGQEATSD